MTRPDRSLPRRQAPPLRREAHDRTNGRMGASPGASRDQAPPGLGVGSFCWFSIRRARSTGDVAGKRSGLPEHKVGGGFRRIPNGERQPFRAPGRAASASIRKGLVRICPVGVFPVRVRYCFLPSVAPIRKTRRNASDPAYGPRSRSGGFCFTRSPVSDLTEFSVPLLPKAQYSLFSEFHVVSCFRHT